MAAPQANLELHTIKHSLNNVNTTNDSGKREGSSGAWKALQCLHISNLKRPPTLSGGSRPRLLRYKQYNISARLQPRCDFKHDCIEYSRIFCCVLRVPHSNHMITVVKSHPARSFLPSRLVRYPSILHLLGISRLEAIHHVLTPLPSSRGHVPNPCYRPAVVRSISAIPLVVIIIPQA